MVRSRVLLAAAVLAAAASAGCVFQDLLSQQGKLAVHVDVLPPRESVENRSDIDDFQTLKVTVETARIMPQRGSQTRDFTVGKTLSFPSLAGEGSAEVLRQPVPGGEYIEWSMTLRVEEAVHKNGSRPTVHTAPGNVYFLQFEGGNRTGPTVVQGETLDFTFVFAVVKDTKEIQNDNVPEGDYFIRLLPRSGPRR